MSDAKKEVSPKAQEENIVIPLREMLDWLEENTNNVIESRILVAMTAVALQEEEGVTIEKQIELALNTITDGNITSQTYDSEGRISNRRH